MTLNENPLADAQREFEELRIESCSGGFCDYENKARRIWVIARMDELQKTIKAIRGKPLKYDWSQVECLKENNEKN